MGHMYLFFFYLFIFYYYLCIIFLLLSRGLLGLSLTIRFVCVSILPLCPHRRLKLLLVHNFDFTFIFIFRACIGYKYLSICHCRFRFWFFIVRILLWCLWCWPFFGFGCSFCLGFFSLLIFLLWLPVGIFSSLVCAILGCGASFWQVSVFPAILAIRTTCRLVRCFRRAETVGLFGTVSGFMPFPFAEWG